MYIRKMTRTMQTITYEKYLERFYYEPERDLLGRGGFATVYKVFDRRKGLHMAIKLADADSPCPLHDEFLRASNVPAHENIAHYNECLTVAMPGGNKEVAVMQYYELGDLEKVLRTLPLDLSQKCDLALGMLRGLHQIHSNGLVHLDLAPKNVLVQFDAGRLLCKITDFGISGKRRERRGFQGGTRHYAAPEQETTRADGQLQYNTDLWAWGVITAEMLLGEILTWEAGSNTVIDREKIQRIPELYRLPVEQCLIEDPTKRVQSAATLLAMLGEAPPETMPTWFGNLMRALIRLSLSAAALLLLYWTIAGMLYLIF